MAAFRRRYLEELARAAALQNASSPKTEVRSMSAEEEFWDRVREKTDAGMPKAKAVAEVVRDDPVLHEEYIAEVNRNRGRR